MNVPDPFFELWLEKDCQVNDVNFNVTTSYTLLFPRNPTRFAVTLIHTSGATFNYAFSEMNPPAGAVQFSVPTAGFEFTFHRRDFGGAIEFPLWVNAALSVSNCLFLEMSYNPHKYAIYQKVMNEYVSKFTAS